MRISLASMVRYLSATVFEKTLQQAWDLSHEDFNVFKQKNEANIRRMYERLRGEADRSDFHDALHGATGGAVGFDEEKRALVKGLRKT